MVILKSENHYNEAIKAAEQLIADKDVCISELSQGVDFLNKKNSALQARYTALFELNQLSQECNELDSFYPKVHKTMIKPLKP